MSVIDYYNQHISKTPEEIATGSQDGTGQQRPEKSSASLKEKTASNKWGSTSKAHSPIKSHSPSKSSHLSKDTRNARTAPECIKVPGPGKKSPNKTKNSKPASADRTNETASEPGLLTNSILFC